jgi:formylmethanofuran dehydrogenase subunit E
MYEEQTKKETYCDLCGEQYPEEKVFRSDDPVRLCLICLLKIEAAPEPIKKSIKDILEGNVL